MILLDALSCAVHTPSTGPRGRPLHLHRARTIYPNDCINNSKHAQSDARCGAQVQKFVNRTSVAISTKIIVESGASWSSILWSALARRTGSRSRGLKFIQPRISEDDGGSSDDDDDPPDEDNSFCQTCFTKFVTETMARIFRLQFSHMTMMH